MRCIFCKAPSSSSKTVEHIIPESLGNTQHTLPAGVVCDKCNNYFAIKVEKPFLDAASIVSVRHRQQIANKRGFVPPLTAIHYETGIAMHLDTDAIYPIKENELGRFVESVLRLGRGKLLLPFYPQEPSRYVTARLLSKIALEALAYQLMSDPLALEEIVDKVELDPIRNYARQGDMRQTVWEFAERKIYSEDALFTESDGKQYQVLHEFTFIQTASQELIFIVAFWGTEYAISLDYPNIKGYNKWIQANDGKSPLYP